MPSNRDPDDIEHGAGKTAARGDELSLTGAGMVGAGPNVGQVGGLDPFPDLGGGAGSAIRELERHVRDPKGAHPAIAISINDFPPLIISDNVEGAINELMANIPPEPPVVGDQKDFLTFSGIPDWGILKLNDSSFVDRAAFSGPVTPLAANEGGIYPYYFRAPSPAIDTEFTDSGEDPNTDPFWNSGVLAGLPGAGEGEAYSGAFTRGTTVMRTDRVVGRSTGVSADPADGLPVRQEVTVSGSLYPADRGVLALIHWPAAGTTASFQAQPLLDRCIAALLLGQGILGDQCFKFGDSVGAPQTGPHVCDGTPGGIFDVGRDSNSEYDPFAYPGRASGQYNLAEINAGVSILDGTPLREPFSDFDGSLGAGASRVQNGTEPGPGQVRLGTDVDANDDAGNAPVQPYGIPVLGGGTGAYSPVPATTVNTNPVVGHSVILGSNFFRYRLPYLKDYNPATGMKYTPSGEDPQLTKETRRYLLPATPNSADPTVQATYQGTPLLLQAGNYANFTEDYYVWQIARYRHTFILQDVAAAGLVEDAGSYWLLHFKRERDFEAFVRDAIMPDDATDGYELFGSYLVGGTAAGVENDGQVANQETDATVQAPDGPAPLFGHGAGIYHSLRSTVILDPSGTTVNPADIAPSTFTWTTGSTAPAEHVIYVSGVAYFLPVDPTNGNSSFQVSSIAVTGANYWVNTFRTDDDNRTGVAQVAPAQVASPNPAFIGMAPFSYEDAGNDTSSMVVPTTFTPDRHVRRARIEFPFSFLGSNGGGAFTEVNGPVPADSLTIGAPASPIEFTGDPNEPAFSVGALPRLHLRRPQMHDDVNNASQPFAAGTGHGVVLTSTDPNSVLFHSSSFDDTNLSGTFGNRVNGGGGVETILVNVFKDTHERFLDETYRWQVDLPGGLPPLVTAAARSALLGPGMGGYAGGPLAVPVRIGRLMAAANWNNWSYLQAAQHTLSLGAKALELQVAGLPDRNPPLSDGVLAPFPSAGLCRYPSVDYSAGFRPSSGDGDITAAQPDYSALTGTREFIRTFDAGFAGATTPVANLAGTSLVTVRVDGLQLRDINYVAPGPGNHPQSGIAIFIKIPGLTTWMDIGRTDGAGPSKQDVALDGAGCQVTGPSTVDGTDQTTGQVFCQIQCNVGPVASLFVGGGTIVGEIPVMVKVQMLPLAAAYAFDAAAGGVPGAFAAPAAGASASAVRGLIGVRILRQDGVATVNAAVADGTLI